jgi:para-nitrobenzyl esterase
MVAKMRTALVFLTLALCLLFFRACNIGSDSNNSHVDVPTPAPLGLQVTLDSGMVLGQEHPESEVWEWLAIPFAHPPTGELRWKAPQPVDAWQGVREAMNFGAPCPQISGGSVIGDEDCLHLNVWRPRSQERGLPVYVWIHGGSNKTASNSLSRFQGDRLAQQSNVVVVSIQLRLGPLGWLYYEPLQTGDPLDDSGNFGLLDIIRSLQWIQDNIEAFGGDTANVTVAGVSSGATNIQNLLLSGQATGLFHKAIIQSSGNPKNLLPEEGMASAALLYDNLTALIGAPLKDPTQQELAQFMRDRSAAELIESSVTIGRFLPFTDGRVIPREGMALLAAGEHFNKVPIIVGTNRDEYKFYTSPLARNEYPAVTAEVRDGIGRYVSDIWRVLSADRFATEITSAPDQPDVYVYRFNWGAPDGEGNSPLPPIGQSLGAHHASEIPFVLGNWEEWIDPPYTSFFFTEDNAVGRQNLSEAIMQYFADFAYSGNPNGSNLPTWEPFTVSGDFKAIEFDVDLVDSSAKLTVDTEVYTIESVLADLDAHLVEPTRSAVLEVLSESGLLD